MSDYLTLIEIARHFGVSVPTIRSAITRHAVGFRVGKNWRFSRDDLTALEIKLREERKPCPSKSAPRTKTRKTTVSGAPSGASALTQAQAQIIALRQRN
jgi:excisionase family DNA binding protein